MLLELLSVMGVPFQTLSVDAKHFPEKISVFPTALTTKPQSAPALQKLVDSFISAINLTSVHLCQLPEAVRGGPTQAAAGN